MLPFFEKRQAPLQIGPIKAFGFPPHLHSQMEIIYTQVGRFSATVSGIPYLLEAGDCLLIFPNTIHSLQECSTTDEDRTTLLIVDPCMTGALSTELLQMHPASSLLPASQVHPDIPYVLHALEQEDTAAMNPLLLTAYIQLFLARAIPALHLIPNDRRESPDLAYRVTDYLSRNFRQPLRLETVAHDLGISSYQLSRFLTQKLDMSFSRYLSQLRIAEAQRLLVSTSLSITQIAFDCGFETQRSFNRRFQELTGATPSCYRRLALASP